MKKLILLALVLAAAGCVTPVQKLGCCMKENATADPATCVLYNTSSFQIQLENGVPKSFPTSGCDNQTGCNVTVDGDEVLIPICSELDLVPCVNQDCRAMVCGDYNFRPKIAPAITGVSDAEGSTPPDLDQDKAALQFYKAQCRFLPMDAKLRQIMKSSKSQINVFRVGVGGSFDEYDQYKYFFPISDKFCNINPPLGASDRRVDRYMNYLKSDLTAYNNPESDITENCVDGTNDYPPMTFPETTSAKSGIAPFFSGSYNPVVPDAENYKFAHWGRDALWAIYSDSNGGYYYYAGSPHFDQSRVFKKIDEAFYRKELSIAHAATIYGKTSAETTRAPFECDSASNECYSGNCNTQIYNRGVMVTSADSSGTEVVTDCNKMADENGRMMVICPPTKDITVSSTPGVAPTISYGSVLARPALLQTSDPLATWPFSFNSLASDSTLFNNYWYSFDDSVPDMFSYTAAGKEQTITNTFYTMYYQLKQKKYCTNEYQNSTDLGYCTDGFVQSSYLPPAGGTVFFGKLKDDKQVQFRGSTIIGYTLADPSSFSNLLLVDQCDVNMTASLPARPSPEEEPFACYSACLNICGASDTTDCNNWCDSSQASPPAPCTPPSGSSVKETPDFVRVELTGPDDQDWKDLVTAFGPYFEDRADAIGKKGVAECNNNIAPSDVVISSMPWVINYEKGLNDPSISLGSLFDSSTNYGSFYPYAIGKHLSATAPQAYRVRNIYDQYMRDTNGTSACDLSRDVTYWWAGWYGSSYPTFYYSMAYSKYIYLWKYDQSRKKIGRCAIDDSTMLPAMKTFGWCEACTTSTLAYQNLTTWDNVYMPLMTENLETGTNMQSICTADYNVNWANFFNPQVTDNVTCVNPYISDVGDYKESIGYYGSPRTKPDATIIKERIGNYLKGGVMPVFDISDASNWNRTNPYAAGDSGDFCLFFLGCESDAEAEYAQYDFERLFGTMGAVVTIIAHVKDAADADAKLDTLVERNTIVHERCFGCLTAIHVDNPTDNESFKETIKAALGHPLLWESEKGIGVDLITFDYRVSDQPASLDTPEALVDNMKSYSRIALTEKRKPTMIVGFNVENDDGTWDYQNHEDLFNAIVTQQDELVKAGLIGIIYSPARDVSGNSGKGLVNLDSNGLGTKSPKFCAFEGAMERMSSIPPTAMFTKTLALDNMTCTPCTALDKTQKKCGPESSGGPGLRCDNGVDCVLPSPLPSGMSESDFKCPESTVVNECTLCKDVPGTYTCTRTYTNGTLENFSGPMSEVQSEIYMDVIAGLGRPDKCCLEISGTNESETLRYSFVKDTMASPINKPVVFPRTGDQNVDCGFGADAGDLGGVSEFCQIESVPIKDYDINCSIS